MRRPVWYARYRLADGRQVQKKIGPAWTDRGRPPTGYFTKRTAEAWLRDVIDEARRVTPASMGRTGVTFANAAAEWLRFIEEDRERKPSTLLDYRSALNAHLLPAFGDQPIESIATVEIERWRRSLVGLSNRSKNKLSIQLHGIFRRAQMVWALPVNPLARGEKHPMRPSCDIQVFSPEEVLALVRAAASRGLTPEPPRRCAKDWRRPSPSPPEDHRAAEAHARVNQPVRVDDRVRPPQLAQRQALAIRQRHRARPRPSTRGRHSSQPPLLDARTGGRYARHRLTIHRIATAKFHDDRDILARSIERVI